MSAATSSAVSSPMANLPRRIRARSQLVWRLSRRRRDGKAPPSTWGWSRHRADPRSRPGACAWILVFADLWQGGGDQAQFQARPQGLFAVGPGEQADVLSAHPLRCQVGSQMGVYSAWRWRWLARWQSPMLRRSAPPATDASVLGKAFVGVAHGSQQFCARCRIPHQRDR